MVTFICRIEIYVAVVFLINPSTEFLESWRIKVLFFPKKKLFFFFKLFKIILKLCGIQNNCFVYLCQRWPNACESID